MTLCIDHIGGEKRKTIAFRLCQRVVITITKILEMFAADSARVREIAR